jgi:hypothetical protein
MEAGDVKFLMFLVNSWAQEGFGAFQQKQFDHLFHWAGVRGLDQAAC